MKTRSPASVPHRAAHRAPLGLLPLLFVALPLGVMVWALRVSDFAFA